MSGEAPNWTMPRHLHPQWRTARAFLRAQPLELPIEAVQGPLQFPVQLLLGIETPLSLRASRPQACDFAVTIDELRPESFGLALQFRTPRLLDDVRQDALLLAERFAHLLLPAEGSIDLFRNSVDRILCSGNSLVLNGELTHEQLASDGRGGLPLDGLTKEPYLKHECIERRAITGGY
jgi:hypothetical protein